MNPYNWLKNIKIIKTYSKTYSKTSEKVLKSLKNFEVTTMKMIHDSQGIYNNFQKYKIYILIVTSVILVGLVQLPAWSNQEKEQWILIKQNNQLRCALFRKNRWGRLQEVQSTPGRCNSWQNNTNENNIFIK